MGVFRANSRDCSPNLNVLIVEEIDSSEEHSDESSDIRRGTRTAEAVDHDL